MSGAVKMIIGDPAKFAMLTRDMKLMMIKGGVSTVNIMAALARRQAVKNLEHNFTVRNTFTKRQIQFTPMPRLCYDFSAIKSTVGVTKKAAYMARQETGGKHVPAKGKKLAIPTTVARGGSSHNPVRLRVRDVLNKSARVHGASNRVYNSQKARLVARAFVAFKNNLFLPMDGSGSDRNIFKVDNWQPAGEGQHRQIKFETHEVYDLNHEQTTTAPRPWLLPACEKVQKDCIKIFESQMRKLGM